MAHNRSTKSLKINKRFTSVELNAGFDCTNHVWGLPIDLKVKGGVLVRANICGSNIETTKGLSVGGNLFVKGNINGTIVQDVILDTFIFPEPSFEGNIEGDVQIKGNLIVTNQLLAANILDIDVPYLGNCIVNRDTDTRVCVLDTNCIKIDARGNNFGQIKSDGAIQLGEAMALDKSFAVNKGNAIAEGAHVEGWNNTGGHYCYVEGGNNRVSEDNASVHLEGYNNMVNVVSGVLFPTCSPHIEGSHNILYYNGDSSNHIEGEYGNCGSDAEYSHIEGNNNQNVDFINSHIEGVDHTASGAGYLVHIEGKGHTVGNVDVLNDSHVEGENNFIEYCRNIHIEGAHNRVEDYGELLYQKYQEIGGTYAQGFQENQEFVRSSGRIEVAGDSQTNLMGAITTVSGGGSQKYFMWTDSPFAFRTRIGSVWLLNIDIIGRENNNPQAGSYSENVVCIMRNNGGTITSDFKSTYLHTSGTMIGSQFTGLSDEGSNTFVIEGNVFGNDAIVHASVFSTQLN